MGWIDNEIDNYYVLKNRWEMNQSSETGQYCFNIEKVDRTDIGYDKEQFVPDNDMKFVLNQSKILELLMGIQLYKDPFLCLREIYQNALDASKCMKAYNKKKGKTENLTIEFGIGEEDLHGQKERYIYCLDHGTGMNAYIIKNYLLHIGNSYYRSKDFAKQNTDWGYDVKPTSQFGIGLLSGYMLADKIGITTIHYEGSGNALSFMMEGVNEHFYYTKPKRTEVEAIGDHGTLVKLYLKEEYRDKVNAEYIPKLPLALMCDNDENDIEEEFWENLFYILNRHIGIKCSEISVMICDSEGNKRELYYCNSIFDQKNYNEISDEEMKNVFENIFYLSGNEDLYKLAIEKKKQIENYVIKVNSVNIELYSHIALPKKGIGEYKRIFDYIRFLGNAEKSIFVDGILIGKPIGGMRQADQILKSDITENSMINFVGKERPTLSIDRNSCVTFPDVEAELEEIRDKFIEELHRIVIIHILKEHISSKDPELLMMLDIIARKFPSISDEVMEKIEASQNIELTLDKKFLEKNKYSLNDLLFKEQICLNNVDFRNYMEITRRAILGRCIAADEIKVENINVVIQGKESQTLPYPIYRYQYYTYDRLTLEMMVICADEWNGIFQEYDIVNKVWPVVNPYFYKCLACEFEVEEKTNRCKTLYYGEEGIIEIANLDPVMIHPVYGISSSSGRRFENKESYVGEFYKNQKQYKLYEMTDFGRLTCEKKVSYVLYVYIAPRDLNEADQKRMEEYNESDPDYVRGVKEGWSILFLGECQKYVICPGIVPRAEMAQKVKEDYRKLTPDITYLYSDGTKVFDE